MKFILVTLIALQAHASDLRYTAKVYDLDDKKHEKLLYNYKSESDNVGNTIVVHNHFTYPDGKPATHEEVTFQRDGSVSLYKSEQSQLKANGQIEIGGGKAKFTWTRDGKTKTSTEDIDSNFVVGSQIPIALEMHWNEIMKGETINRRLAVIDRQESIGFNFSKDGETEIDGKKIVVIKMKASSIIIAAVVSAVYFYMTPDGKELVEIKGRTTVRKDRGNGSFGDLDADIIYTKGPAPIPEPVAQPVVKPASGGNSK